MQLKSKLCRYSSICCLISIANLQEYVNLFLIPCRISYRRMTLFVIQESYEVTASNVPVSRTLFLLKRYYGILRQNRKRKFSRTQKSARLREDSGKKGNLHSWHELCIPDAIVERAIPVEIAGRIIDCRAAMPATAPIRRQPSSPASPLHLRSGQSLLPNCARSIRPAHRSRVRPSPRR